MIEQELEGLTSLPHAMACSNMDFDFFYSGLEGGALLVQRCNACASLRNPPAPVCPGCGSFKWSAEALSGRGHVHSFVIHHYPPLPNIDTPHAILVVDMEEGIRFVGAGNPADRDAFAIDAPVKVEFVRRNEVALYHFALTQGRG